MSQLVLSLFPGLDLLGHAFEQEGFCVVAGPDVCWGRDVRQFHPPAGRFEGIIGGPPCQTFSTLANLVRAKGLEPSFGNLIPDYVRCVEEAAPAWFLMENVSGVPEDCWPAPRFYSVHQFVLDNAWLDDGNGFGQEQMRKRRFWFGVRGRPSVDLRKWIRLAVFELPPAGCVVGGHDAAPGQRDAMRRQVQTVTHRPERVPVAIGGSGKVKRTAVSQNMVNNSPEAKRHVFSVTGAHPCSHRPKNGHGERYTLADMLRLQGMPEDALDHAPFTMHGKRKLIGNGVPIAMGRALAQAIRQATTAPAAAKGTDRGVPGARRLELAAQAGRGEGAPL